MPHYPFRFGIVAGWAATADEWVAKARHAEELGYATLLIPDRLGRIYSPFPALAALATATRQIRLGTFVVAAGLRNPVLLAADAATLDVLSGGRFELGIGAGVGEDDFRRAGLSFGAPGERVARLTETLQIVKPLLAGETVTFRGAHYSVEGVTVAPRPVQRPRPPILVAGAGDRLLDLAAREADVVALGVSPLATDADIAVKVERIRQAAGARFSELQLSLNLQAVLVNGVVDERVRARVRGFLRVEIEDLTRAGSVSVLAGEVDQIVELLHARRERLGVSYLTLPDDLMDSFAPVVSRLTGR
jgi:probable F420-dependent oxidoreductase